MITDIDTGLPVPDQQFHHMTMELSAVTGLIHRLSGEAIRLRQFIALPETDQQQRVNCAFAAEAIEKAFAELQRVEFRLKLAGQK